MIKREVFEKIGLFDPRYFLFWEESDLCLRAKKEGFEVRTCPKAKVWHKVSASFMGKPHAAYFLHRHRLLWIERNLQGSKRLLALVKLISASFIFFYRKKTVRSLQLLLQKCTKKETKRNRERIVRYNAALCGTWDYLFRKFGPGRSKKFMNCL